MLPSVRMPRGTPISSWLHLIFIELLLHLIIPPYIEVAMSNQEMNVGRHILGKDLSPQIKSSPDTTFLKYISCKEIYLAFCLNFSTSWNSELLTAFNNSHMLRSKASGTPKMLADTEEFRNTLISQSAYVITTSSSPGCQISRVGVATWGLWEETPESGVIIFSLFGTKTWGQAWSWIPAGTSSLCCPWRRKEIFVEISFQVPFGRDQGAKCRVNPV